MRTPTLISLDRRRTTAALALVVAVFACKPVEPPVPVGLAVVQGNNQMAQAGTELPAQIVVRLVDIDGAPVPDFNVGFVVLAGGGTVNPSAAPTDENGEVKVKWTLGPNESDQSIMATSGTVEPAQVFATGLLPANLIVAQGAGQAANAGAGLPNPIVVRVVGPNNVPLKGIPVAFTVTSGGGLISPASGVTNASGEVQSRWTLGPQPGLHTIQVVAGSLQAVQIVATAN
jgi:hypothetical protein